MQKPKWSNLKNNQCPICTADLEPEAKDDMLACSSCPFTIREQRFGEIVNSQIMRDLDGAQGF